MSACLGGEVPRLLNAGRYDDAKKVALEYEDILGRDNFYLELQDNGIPEQEQVNREIIRRAARRASRSSPRTIAIT